MSNRFRVVVALFGVLVSLAGCGGYSVKIETTDLGSPDTYGLSAAGEPVKALVVYFHGADQNAHVIQDDKKHMDFFDPMLRAGYAVVAADAQGNAYGNPQSRADYRRLITNAREKFGNNVPIFYVAESMGALAALALLSEDTEHQVKGFVGITAVMALPPEARALTYIIGPWAGAVPDAADPVTWPPEDFAGRDFRLYRSDQDTTVPDIAGARAFADRFGSVANIDVIDCPGGHVAPACFRGDEVAEWMKKRE
jgi:alpha-beta hydrolase superfamily lysophospholipase